MANMGNPAPWTGFSGGPPMGAWDDSKLTSDFRGSFHTVGGSMPEEGHSPFDETPAVTNVSSDMFYNLPTQGSFSSAAPTVV